MAKIKTSELTAPALDWCVAKAIGEYRPVPVPAYSTDWAQGGPIIERERINLDQFVGHPARAYKGTPVAYESVMFAPEGQVLIAAMRCYVAAFLGDEVDVPDELVGN